MVTRSCKNSGLFLCIILKVSKAIVLILRVLSEGNLEFWSSVSYELSESQALVSFKKYMPPPLPYFKVNIL
jgi:hypothetical protein